MAKNCRDCGVKTCNPLMPRCYDCSIAYMQTDEFKQKKAKLKAKADERAAKRERAKQRQAKEDVKPKNVWLKEVEAACNRYVRLLDHDKPCISCQRHHKGQYHAGHYRAVGACSQLRYEVGLTGNPRNIYKQCSACNNYLGGNYIEYRINLVKMGVDVDWLERKDHPIPHWTIPELKEMKKDFNRRANELQKKIDKGE